MVRHLLPKYHDLDSYDEWLAKRGRWGMPLTTACQQAELDTVRLLLERMPDVDINEHNNIGNTALLSVAASSYGLVSEDEEEDDREINVAADMWQKTEEVPVHSSSFCSSMALTLPRNGS